MSMKLVSIQVNVRLNSGTASFIQTYMKVYLHSERCLLLA